MPASAKTLKTPRYVQMANELRSQIRSGQRQPGERLPSFQQMRLQRGITQGTLERAYMLLEEDGLVERRLKSGTYVSSPKPRALTSVIGFAGSPITTDISAYAKGNAFEYWAPLMAGVQSTLLPENQRLLLLDFDSPSGWDLIDGLLTFGGDSANMLRWVPEDLPVVALVNPCEGITSVVSDDAKGVRQAVEYLVGLGHRRIAYMIQEPSIPILEWRLFAYHAALRAGGIKGKSGWVRHVSVVPDYRTQGYNLMRRWLEEDWRGLGCTALLAQNDDTAIGAMTALQEAGIQVPDQVSVIGFDNSLLCDYPAPALTSVDVPLQQIGARGGEILLQQIRGERAVGAENAETISLPTRMEIRCSTAKALKENL